MSAAEDHSALLALASAVERLGSEVAELTKRLPARNLTIQEAARELGVSESTMRRRIKDGEIAHAIVRVGSAVRVNMDALRAPSEAEVRTQVAKLHSV